MRYPGFMTSFLNFFKSNYNLGSSIAPAPLPLEEIRLDEIAAIVDAHSGGTETASQVITVAELRDAVERRKSQTRMSADSHLVIER
jgi:hypothetical protein